MPWSTRDYPTSMKNLTAEVRHKAIDVANALLDEGYEEGRAIVIATAQAEKWAKNRHQKIRKDNAEGTTGQAVESDQGSGHPIHVMLDANAEKWLAQQDQQRLAQGSEKEDVVTKARAKAKAQNTCLYIHTDSGDLETEEDYA